MKDKSYLVLGGSGFCGSHLVKGLLQNNCEDITVVDITKHKLQDTDNINWNYVKFKKINLLYNSIEDLIREHDVVINLVAICNPSEYVRAPLLTFEVGFVSNLKVIEQCVKHNKRLIHFSTSEVYGKSPSIYNPDSEYYFNEETSDCILGPISKQRWIYACGKQLLDRVIYAHGEHSNFDYSIIRPFNYIGERIDYLPLDEEKPRVFSSFLSSLMRGRDLHVIDGGTQKRCYLYIEDATDAHLRIVQNKDNLCSREIFNVGCNENETSIYDLAVLMKNIYLEKIDNRCCSNIVQVSGEQYYGKGYEDCDRRLLDNSKLKSKTGWSHKWDLPSMIEKAMRYYCEK